MHIDWIPIEIAKLIPFYEFDLLQSTRGPYTVKEIPRYFAGARSQSSSSFLRGSLSLIFQVTVVIQYISGKASITS